MTVVPGTFLAGGTCMRLAALALVGVLGLLGAAASARAAPAIPNLGPQQDPNIIRVWGGCGWGFHPNPWGGCVPNRYGYYRYRPYWGSDYGYRPHWGGYYGGGRDFPALAHRHGD